MMVLVCFIAACGATSFDPNAARSIDRQATLAVLESMYSSYGERFTDSTETLALRHYTKDACIMAPNQPRLCGIDSIVWFNWHGGDNIGLDVRMHPEEVTGTLTEISEIGRFEIFNSAGEQRNHGKYMAVHRWQDGKWKVYREIWNSDRPWE